MQLLKSLQNCKSGLFLFAFSSAALNPAWGHAQNSIDVQTDLTNLITGVEPVNIRAGGFLNESQILELAENGLPLIVKAKADRIAVDLLIEVCGDLDSNADYFADRLATLNSLVSIEDNVVAGDELLIPFCPYRKFENVTVKDGDTLSKIYIDFYSKNLPVNYANKVARQKLLNYNPSTLKVIGKINGFEPSSSESQPNYSLSVGSEIKLPIVSLYDRWFIAETVRGYDFTNDFDKIIVRPNNWSSEFTEVNDFGYLEPSDLLITSSENVELAWIPNKSYFGSLPSLLELERNSDLEESFRELLSEYRVQIEETRFQINNLRKNLNSLEVKSRQAQKLKSFGLVMERGGASERDKIRKLHLQITEKEGVLREDRKVYEALSQNSFSGSQKVKIPVQENDTPTGLVRLCESTALDVSCDQVLFQEPKINEVIELIPSSTSLTASKDDIEKIQAFTVKKSTVRLASKITSERGNAEYLSSLTMEPVKSAEIEKSIARKVEKGVFEHLSNIPGNGECAGYTNKTIPDKVNFLKLFTRQANFAREKHGDFLSKTTVGIIDTGVGMPIDGQVWNIHFNEMFSERTLSKNDNQSTSMEQGLDNSIPGDVYGISLTGCEQNCSKDGRHHKYGHLGFHKTQFYKDRFKHGTNVASIMLGGKGYVTDLGYEPIQLTSVNVTNRINPFFVGSEGIIEGIEYFTSNTRGRTPKPRIINISYKTKDTSEKFETFVSFPEDHLFVVAAGQNDVDTKGSDLDDASEEVWPANMGGKRGLPNVITVGASKANKKLDPPKWANFGIDRVDLFAPGCNVEVYSPGYTTPQRSSPPKYETASGSSMAAPQVTFGASLISYLSNNRLTPRRIKNRILVSADTYVPYSDKSSTGGVFNIEKSINVYSDLVIKVDGTQILGLLDEKTKGHLISPCDSNDKEKLKQSRLKKILVTQSQTLFWRSTYDHEYNYTPVICQGVNSTALITILDDETGVLLDIPLAEVKEIIRRELNRN